MTYDREGLLHSHSSRAGTLESLDSWDEEPRSGDLFERSIETKKGVVDLLAEVVVEEKTLILRDIVIYSRSATRLTGLTRDVLAARTKLIAKARAFGFETLRITGHRIEGSSSGNPGHSVDVRIDLSR